MLIIGSTDCKSARACIANPRERVKSNTKFYWKLILILNPPDVLAVGNEADV